jgi:hypothetical protein
MTMSLHIEQRENEGIGILDLKGPAHKSSISLSRKQVAVRPGPRR